MRATTSSTAGQKSTQRATRRPAELSSLTCGSRAGRSRTAVAGIDTLVAIEDLVGSGFADQLIGDAKSNRINGDLDQGAAFDILDGQGGTDTVVYVSANSDVQLDLGFTGVQNTGGGETTGSAISSTRSAAISMTELSAPVGEHDRRSSRRRPARWGWRSGPLVGRCGRGSTAGRRGKRYAVRRKRR